MSTTKHHTEWLSLVPVSGPFVSLPVLTQVFPQGLDKVATEDVRRLRLAYEEWREAKRQDAAAQRRWVRFVLSEGLGYGAALREGQDIPAPLQATLAEHGEVLRPDFIVREPGAENASARVLVQVHPPWTPLDRPLAGARWKVSPETRLAQLLSDTGVRLGLCTNGERFTLIHARRGEPTSFAAFYAELWLEEPLTLRALRSLLGVERLFGVPADQSTEALYERSAADQHEVTDQLGYQVRRAVEVLIQALDKADQDHGRALLGSVPPVQLYEAALTVMMRLVFLFCAEERELLLLGDDLYDRGYAASTLREQLRAAADTHGEEVLGLRHDAWARLLSIFRAVYAGVRHERLMLPAYGGALFDPDRFPFLEGRPPRTSFTDTPAQPLPISNRTVLHLLESLQLLEVRMPGAGGTKEARRLSFRALDIEQIGHVYEGLLDHTALRASEPVLGLSGTRDKEPEIALAELERLHKASVSSTTDRDEALVGFLREQTGRSETAIKKAIEKGRTGLTEMDAQAAARLRTACGGDEALFRRVAPFAALLRPDSYGYPVVLPTGSVYVTAGTDRRSSGTHYTPKTLTEPIARHTLEPLCYTGPAEGLPREAWTLRPARVLLDLKVCDLACGSGAFLVQACRYLAARLLEAWEAAKTSNPGAVHITPFGEPSTGQPGEQLLPEDLREREVFALRLCAQRCLYGVDKNPLAVEMAKLSLWLLTLAKDKPFEFLDHAIRSGDSLVGLRSLDQLRTFSLDGEGEANELLARIFDRQIDKSIELRKQIEASPASTLDEVRAQERLQADAESQSARLRAAADLLIAAEFVEGSAREKSEARARAAERAGHLFDSSSTEEDLAKVRSFSRSQLGSLHPFHWPLEFPEVLIERGGFDAFVGNPPFMGGQKITGALGDAYRDYLVERLASGQRGSADLCAYFFLRINDLVHKQGGYGLIATNTISQGDTREVGLEQIEKTGTQIYRAVPSQKWPGTANLEIAQVWACRSEFKGEIFLDGQSAPGVTAFLTAQNAAAGKPYRLKANEGGAYIGSYVLGMGFILTQEEARELLNKDSKNEEIVLPYMNGKNLNTDPHQKPDRWVINFRDLSIESASRYQDCFQLVQDRVKPDRDRLAGGDASARDRARRWWQFARPTLNLYKSIRTLKRVLTIAQTSNTQSPIFIEQDINSPIIFDQKIVVFCSSDALSFMTLASSFHYLWIIANGSTMRTDAVYTPSDCFETFPFPDYKENCSGIGEIYHSYRSQLMDYYNEGLTRIYNRFHDSSLNSADITKLRTLHQEMDYAVAAAYGWTDLDLGHGFHETKQGVRYTLSEPARREVLARLLRLNHERYAEEVAQGLHDKDKKKQKAAPKKAAEPTANEPSPPEKIPPAKRGRKPKPPGDAGGQGSLF